MANIYHSSSIAFQSSHPNLFQLEDAQNIRLQRLIHQRKRMEHMTLLIGQQKQTIDILKEENSSINQQFFQLKLENQLLTDKLSVAQNHCQSLTEVLIKQISLIKNLRGCLFGGLQMTEYQLNLMDQKIQESLSLYHAITAEKASLHVNKSKGEMSDLIEENQILSEKYQNLCTDYLELTKTLKMKEYELLKYQNSKLPQIPSSQHQTFQGGISKRKSRQPGSIENKEEKTQLSQLIKSKDSEIIKLKQTIQNLRTELSQKDILIQEHRNNEKQQKKLLTHLKAKFNEQGKHLSQIIKSKNIIEVLPQSKTELRYEIEKPDRTSAKKRHASQVPPAEKIVETRVFEEQNLNLNPSCVKSSSRSNLVSKVQSTNQEVINDSGFKKTVSKNVILNLD